MSEVSLVPDEIRIAGSGYSHVALFRHVLEGHLIPSKFQESNSQVQFNRESKLQIKLFYQNKSSLCKN